VFSASIHIYHSLTGLHSNGKIALTANIRLGLNVCGNALAYYDTATTKAVKRFIVKGPGPMFVS
jgi:hypothetical protein